MKYYLDTNICIYFLKAANNNLKKKILSENPDNIKIPSIVKANNGILVTNNTKEFKRVSDLQIIDWST